MAKADKLSPWRLARPKTSSPTGLMIMGIDDAWDLALRWVAEDHRLAG